MGRGPEHASQATEVVDNSPHPTSTHIELFTADAISRDIKITSNRDIILDLASSDVASVPKTNKHKFNINVIQKFIEAKKD